MRVCFFEDAVDHFEPLALTRPVFELRCGARTLREKWMRLLAPEDWGVLLRPNLEECYRTAQPTCRVNSLTWLTSGPTLLVNPAWMPPDSEAALPGSGGACLGVHKGRVVWAQLETSHLLDLTSYSLTECLARWRLSLPMVEATGKLLEYPWDLVAQNHRELIRDFRTWVTDCGSGWTSAPITLHGPRENVWVDPTARIEPFVHVDTTAGPVILDRETVVTAFTRLEGPCYVGPGTQLMGARVRGGVSFGPQCRIGGEVEASIVHGYTNKYHEGFLGHSYLGEWVNLGAGTHNSDLRNDYGEVTMVLAGRTIQTGLTKVGCFIGDHSKTGLGTLLNTGTNVGAFCNLLPAGRLAPKYAPSFLNWWNGALDEGFAFEQLMHTARQVMRRRGQDLSEPLERLYRRLYDEGVAERRRVLHGRPSVSRRAA